MGLKTLIYHQAEKEKSIRAQSEMHIYTPTNYERILGCQVHPSEHAVHKGKSVVVHISRLPA